MNEKTINNENEIKGDNQISLLVINKELYNIFNNKNYAINIFLSKNEKIKSTYLIDLKEMKLFNYFLLYLIRASKARNIFKFLELNKLFYKKNNDQIILVENANNKYNKIKLILPKFFMICIFNSYELGKFLNYNNKEFTEKIFELIQIYYLNNLIDKESLVNIIRLKII